MNSAKISQNNLFILQDSKQYLYARDLYKENLIKIIDQNKMDGVKFVSRKNYSLNHFQIKTESKLWKIFNGQILESQFKRVPLSNGNELIHLSYYKPRPVIKKEFEIRSNWKIVSGQGEISFLKLGNGSSNKALFLKAKPGPAFILQTSNSINLETNKAGLLVLIWTMKRSNARFPVFYPALTFPIGITPRKSIVKIPFGKINEGINILIPENSADYFSDIWSVNAILGKIPQGKYSFNLWLKCQANNTVVYDNFRLFFVPFSIDLSKDFGSP